MTSSLGRSCNASVGEKNLFGQIHRIGLARGSHTGSISNSIPSISISVAECPNHSLLVHSPAAAHTLSNRCERGQGSICVLSLPCSLETSEEASASGEGRRSLSEQGSGFVLRPSQLAWLNSLPLGCSTIFEDARETLMEGSRKGLGVLRSLQPLVRRSGRSTGRRR